MNTITNKSSSALDIGIDESFLDRASFFKNQSLQLERLQISDSNLKDLQDRLVENYNEIARVYSEIVDSLGKLNMMRNNRDVEGQTKAEAKLREDYEWLTVVNMDNQTLNYELNRLCQ